MTVRFYQTNSGQEPVRKYLQQLPVKEAAELGVAIEELACAGPRAGFIDVRQLRWKLWEVRVGHHRILFAQIRDAETILLHAYKKQKQRTPNREIDLALWRLKQLPRAVTQ